MAAVLKSYQFSGLAIYPWDKWLDGQIWKLIQGEDFEISPINFRVSAHRTAKQRNMKLRTRIEGADIIIQALPLHVIQVPIAVGVRPVD